MSLLTVVALAAVVLMAAYFTYGRFLSAIPAARFDPADAGRRDA